MNIGHRARLVAGVVVGLVVAGGSAYATTVDTSGTETAACITPSKYIRVLADGAECRRRETAISLPSMDTVDALSSAINDTSAQIDDIYDGFTAVYDELDGKADALGTQAQVDDLQSQLGLQSDAIDATNGVIDGLATDLYSLLFDASDAISVNADDIAQTASDLSDLSDTVDALDATKAAQSDLEDEVNRASDAEATLFDYFQNYYTVDSIDAKFAASDAFAADTAANISSVMSDVDALTTAQNALSTAVAANATDIANLSNSVTAAFATRDAQIKALQDDVKALKDAVAALTPVTP